MGPQLSSAGERRQFSSSSTLVDEIATPAATSLYGLQLTGIQLVVHSQCEGLQFAEGQPLDPTVARNDTGLDSILPVSEVCKRTCRMMTPQLIKYP